MLSQKKTAIVMFGTSILHKWARVRARSASACGHARFFYNRLWSFVNE